MDWMDSDGWRHVPVKLTARSAPHVRRACSVAACRQQPTAGRQHGAVVVCAPGPQRARSGSLSLTAPQRFWSNRLAT
jgi:hypothetical protein